MKLSFGLVMLNLCPSVWVGYVVSYIPNSFQLWPISAIIIVMKNIISRSKVFSGKPIIPGDKSISHRGLILGALASGTSEVIDILEGEDVQSTAHCLRELGVEINSIGNKTFIKGIGDKGFKNPNKILDCGNSGTTMRVMMGVLAGRPVTATLTGDSSLVKRPMKRVSEPLLLMGANFKLTNENYAPLIVTGGIIYGIDYHLKIASAQIKTAIIMAAISAEGSTRIHGEIGSRDHTEKLLPHFGIDIKTTDKEIIISGGQSLKANTVKVPGDPSTAAFWIGAASIIPGATIDLDNISLNPTRIGFMNVLKRMGADIQMDILTTHPEPVGSIHVSFRGLVGTTISKDEIPSLIDEIPLIAVLATQATGITIIRGAEELRVKESDRLEAVATNLRAMGCEIEVFEDGFKIEGPQKLTGCEIQTFHDHRIAMAFSIAGLVADKETTIQNSECVAVSYPNFYETLAQLTKE
ncbi:MAG: 3-phosphoshikimate 1-carboxyvinyltransferase [Bacteriovorax sp.]|nr:3-phosphoshikimate 1-carboxyvinyltransferase [Bacteriovorax sp.]